MIVNGGLLIKSQKLNEWILNLHYSCVVRDLIRIHEVTETWKWKDTLREEVEHMYITSFWSFGPNLT